MTDEGKIKTFKNLVKERYIITKNTSTSYEEAGNLTPIERKYFIEFLEEESKQVKDAIEKRKQAIEAKKANNNPNHNSTVRR